MPEQRPLRSGGGSSKSANVVVRGSGSVTDPYIVIVTIAHPATDTQGARTVVVPLIVSAQPLDVFLAEAEDGTVAVDIESFRNSTPGPHSTQIMFIEPDGSLHVTGIINASVSRDVCFTNGYGTVSIFDEGETFQYTDVIYDPSTGHIRMYQPPLNTYPSGDMVFAANGTVYHTFAPDDRDHINGPTTVLIIQPGGPSRTVVVDGLPLIDGRGVTFADDGSVHQVTQTCSGDGVFTPHDFVIQ